MVTRRCDKCSLPVEPENDATLLEAIRYKSEKRPSFLLSVSSRHLFPVYDGEKQRVCEGSPSRAQYLEGQPRDKRPEYCFKGQLSILEKWHWRRAYRELKARVAAGQFSLAQAQSERKEERNAA